MKHLPSLVGLLLLSTHVSAQSPGDVLGTRKLSFLTEPALADLNDEDRLGVWIDGIGDLDGDGIPDAVAGTHRDDDGGDDAGAVRILFLRADGSIRESRKISPTAGGFAGRVDAGDRFGKSVAALGDVDGDGVTDLVVGAYQDDDGGINRGAVWILFLNPDGTVKGDQKISPLQGNLNDPLGNESSFGWAVEGLGDLNGDGVPDLAVGHNRDDDGGFQAGATWILFLNPDGTVQGRQKISSLAGGFTGQVTATDRFGADIAPLGDLDDDGVLDIAVGAWQDDDGGPNRGAVWLLFLNPDGTVKAHDKIGSLNGVPGLLNHDRFGIACENIGDVDGDGRVDLAVGTFEREGNGFNQGSVWILFLGQGGTVLGSREIGAFPPVSLPLADEDKFGCSIGSLGDLDGDGNPELLVGAYQDDDGGPNRGALWVVEIAAAATPAPVAAFASSVTSGDPPLVVDFTNLSTGVQASWSWDFGDGGGSAERSPQHVFATPGTYDVSLTTTGPGGFDTLVVPGAIQVFFQPPVAGFDGTPAAGPAPLAVAFADQSTGDVFAWEWDFGDGQTSSEANPSHVYAAPGTYDVGLTVTGNGGSDSLLRTAFVTVEDPTPVAAFHGSPLSGFAPLSVAFVDDSTGAIDGWSWDFGDGATSTEAAPVHDYLAEGTFDVALTVSGPAGSDQRVEVGYVTVTEQPPLAAFDVTPASGVAPLPVAFTDLSLGVIDTWSWDFGDGTQSSEPSPAHVYPLAGSYPVTLTVSGPLGADSTGLTVEVAPPVGFGDGGFELSAGGAPPSTWPGFGPGATTVSVATGEVGWPTQGNRWLRLDTTGTTAAQGPTVPGGVTDPPVGGTGVVQTFRCPEGALFLEFDAAFLPGGPFDPLANDWMSVDVSDGTTTVNLYYADTATPTPGTSALVGLAMTDTTHVAADLAALFPGAGTFTAFTLTVQVGNGGDGNVPSFGYVDAFGLTLTDVIPGMRRLGCGGNPEGSLVHSSGTASINNVLRFAMHNPLGTQSPGSFTLLALSNNPASVHPCGDPGFGMAGPGAVGELVIALVPAPFKIIQGPPWSGAPTIVPLPIPNQAGLIGRTIYVQGQLLDPTAALGVDRGLTTGYELTFQP